MGLSGAGAGASSTGGTDAGGRGGSAVGSGGAGGAESPGIAGGAGAALGGAGGAGGIGTMAPAESGGTGAGANCLHGDVNIRGTTVSGTITVNGGPLTAIKGFVSVELRNAAGDNVFLGSSRSYATEVIPGTYDLYATWKDPAASTLVTNSPIKLRSGIVVGTSPLPLDIDVPATTVSGTFTVKGATITTYEHGDCVLWLRSAAGEDMRAHDDHHRHLLGAGRPRHL